MIQRFAPSVQENDRTEIESAEQRGVDPDSGCGPERILRRDEGWDCLDDRGGLVFTTANGELLEDAPEIYQEAGGARVAVEGAFRISGEVVSFHVGQYDRSRPLRIDPVLSYSTYLGGAGTDKANAIAVDGNGSAYVTGYTDSTDFPVSGGVVRPISGGGVDAFVTKLNSTGSAIVYSTYLGGNGDDRGFSIAVDGSGDVYVTGYTNTTDFPTTPGAYRTTFGGYYDDAFVTKITQVAETECLPILPVCVPPPALPPPPTLPSLP